MRVGPVPHRRDREDFYRIIQATNLPGEFGASIRPNRSSVSTKDQNMANAPPDMKAKAEAFHALHQAPGTFIIPNPWDRGSARILAQMGFKALATTSMGYAFSIGQRDNSLTREQTLANAADSVGATDLPVNADLENGFGDAPEDP